MSRPMTVTTAQAIAAENNLHICELSKQKGNRFNIYIATGYSLYPRNNRTLKELADFEKEQWKKFEVKLIGMNPNSVVTKYVSDVFNDCIMDLIGGTHAQWHTAIVFHQGQMIAIIEKK